MVLRSNKKVKYEENLITFVYSLYSGKSPTFGPCRLMDFELEMVMYNIKGVIFTISTDFNPPMKQMSTHFLGWDQD